MNSGLENVARNALGIALIAVVALALSLRVVLQDAER